MSRYRHHLPFSDFKPFLSDGGLETTLVFQEGVELPHFAAFDLLKNEGGVAQLTRYYDGYAELARERAMGFILETPTWRASSDWGLRLGYDAGSLGQANRRCPASNTKTGARSTGLLLREPTGHPKASRGARSRNPSSLRAALPQARRGHRR